MFIMTETVSINTVGLAGAALGSADTKDLFGFLLDVYLNYHASCPATADVTISEATLGTICVKSNNATDIRLAPRMATHDIAAAATGVYDQYPISGPITIAVAEADALTACLVATIRWLII